ncbi:MAG: radical SAM protein, partial [Clostridia bacterium]|nr:radical SAM protein [Clostridia bacterium]
MGSGKEITIEDLSEIFLKHQRHQAHNINLVSGAIYADKIAKALEIAKAKGLNIPVIYNSNGYEDI